MKTNDRMRPLKFFIQLFCVTAVAVGAAGCGGKKIHKKNPPAPPMIEPATTIPAATAGEPDQQLLDAGREQLEKLQYLPMPVYSKTGTLGIVRLGDPNECILENATVILGGELLITNTRLKLADGNVFFNVDKKGPAKVGEFELKRGECVLFKDGKFTKIDTVIK